jgi:hypothetical protein
LAVRYSRECLGLVKKENDVVVAALQAAQASGNRPTLEAAIRHMREHITLMQSRTDNVADHSGLMIGGGTNRKTGLDCFNTNFDKLSEIVRTIDEEIIRSKDALRAAWASR